ncbi:MAG: cohesin domain-containing protein, partial [Methylococcales bacterium]
MNKKLIAKLIALAVTGFFHSAEAATTLTVILPNHTNTFTTSVGSFFDAGIYVDGLADFAGFDFNLTYNSNNLSALTLTSGDIFGADTVSFANTISPGSIHFAQALSDTSLATSGLNVTAPTLLGTVHFKALAVNASIPVDITNPQIYSFDGTSLAGTLQGAKVIVTAAPAAVPLPVPTFL